MIKRLTFIYLLILLGCNLKLKTKIDGYILFDLGINTITFEIKNNSNNNIWIPLKYPDIYIVNDSIIIEGYDTSTNIDYCTFPFPELELVKPNLSAIGKVSSVSFSKFEPSKFKYFIRVFDKSFQKYIIEEKIDAVSEKHFMLFQSRFSSLIPLKLMSYP